MTAAQVLSMLPEDCEHSPIGLERFYPDGEPSALEAEADRQIGPSAGIMWESKQQPLPFLFNELNVLVEVYDGYDQRKMPPVKARSPE